MKGFTVARAVADLMVAMLGRDGRVVRRACRWCSIQRAVSATTNTAGDGSSSRSSATASSIVTTAALDCRASGAVAGDVSSTNPSPATPATVCIEAPTATGMLMNDYVRMTLYPMMTAAVTTMMADRKVVALTTITSMDAVACRAIVPMMWIAGTPVFIPSLWTGSASTLSRFRRNLLRP